MTDNQNPSLEEVIERLKESKPPATDTFTYLTIIEKSLSPEILPALHEILQDVELTKDIGWDLVGMLLPVPGSEHCLETVAQLGNPREVMLMVYEILGKITRGNAGEEDDGEEGDDRGAAEASKATSSAATTEKQFVSLLGMLMILHKRLEVQAPSRFVHATLQTVARCYDPSSASMTAAVIELARSLSGNKRPPLPTRRSSTKLATPFQTSDAAKNAPDPEAEKAGQEDPIEPALVTRLLQSFITTVIGRFVDENRMEWAARQLEFYFPDKVVRGRKSVTATFNEDETLSARDALVGQLVVRPRSLSQLE